MKWPKSLVLIRHDVSAYNILKDIKSENPEYRKFLKEWEKCFNSPKAILLANKLYKKFMLGVGDASTPLVDEKGDNAIKTGLALAKDEKISLPDVIFVSPYERTLSTLSCLIKGWPALGSVKIYEEERIREQEHGLASLYNDWKIFFTLHPEQKFLQKKEGRYWYRWSQGENVSDVRERNRSWTATLIREFSEKNVLVVSHHLNILATRANFERLGAEEFIQLDENEKPINCGVTLYKGNPNLGKDGKLELVFYNKKYH
jgi:broad specificity phosphatase PhoE